MTEVVHEPSAMFSTCEGFRAQGHRVGLVPTMGALHEGHMSLVDAARRHGAARIVLSIFVNPTQFGPSDDFHKYPRTLEQDLVLCRKHNVEVVYAPNVEDLYPPSFQTFVQVEQVTQPLEGTFRPTHFRGVTTIVTKLFNATGPCVATFGRKDYQQWRTLARMAKDLDMPVEVIGCPILREPDGLAMSSRNRYLDPAQRERAIAIVQGLRAADAAYRQGERDPQHLESIARAIISARFDSIDYVSVADAESLSPCPSPIIDPAVLLVAAKIGQTRLIDNAVLGQDALG